MTPTRAATKPEFSDAQRRRNPAQQTLCEGPMYNFCQRCGQPVQVGNRTCGLCGGRAEEVSSRAEG